MWKVKIKETANDTEGNPNIISITYTYYHTDGREEDRIERISNFSSENIKMLGMQGVQFREQIDANEKAKKELLNNPPIGDILFVILEPTIEELENKKEEKLAKLKKQLEIKYITQEEYDAKVSEIKTQE